MMKRKLPGLILTQPGVATVVMVVVTLQIPAGVTPVAAIALEVTVLMAVVIQQITLGGIPVETEVTPTILEVIQQVVYGVRESVNCLLAMSVS